MSPSVEEKLTPSARDALMKLATMLSSGFTGTLELVCSDGGVQQVRQSTKWKPGESPT